MGTFGQRIGIANMAGGPFAEVDALVDTGAAYAWLPSSILKRLGVSPHETASFILADGREVEYPLAWIRVRIDRRTEFTLCIFGDEGTEPLLGSFTLEAFRLAVDPFNKRLIPVPGLLKLEKQTP